MYEHADRFEMKDEQRRVVVKDQPKVSIDSWLPVPAIIQCMEKIFFIRDVPDKEGLTILDDGNSLYQPETEEEE